MNFNSIYSTVSNGRTHIAIGQNYLGNVNSYNNFLTRFFAWVFGRSTSVNFDGKQRSVNKKSYVKLLGSLGQNGATIENIERYTFFKDAVKNYAPTSQSYMREHLSENTKQKLFRRLAVAISTADTEKAKKMIRKGADIEKVYFDRGHRSPSFYSPAEDLEAERRYEFKVFEAPPILQAAFKSNTAVAQELKNYGANLQAQGQSYTYKREITHVTRHLEYGMSPSMDRDYLHHPNTFDNNLRNLHERTVVHTKDTRSVPEFFQLDSNLKLVKRAN